MYEITGMIWSSILYIFCSIYHDMYMNELFYLHHANSMHALKVTTTKNSPPFHDFVEHHAWTAYYLVS